MALYGFRPAHQAEPALSRRTSTEGGSAGRAKSLLSELMARAEAAGGQSQHPNNMAEGDEDGWMQGEEDEGLYDEEEEDSDEQQQEENEGGMPVPQLPIEVLKHRRSYLQRLLYSREVEEMLLQAQSWITSQPASGKACVQARLCLSAASLLKHQQHAARQQGF